MKDKCIGMMEALMLDNGKEDFQMVKVIYNLTKSGIFKVKG